MIVRTCHVHRFVLSELANTERDYVDKLNYCLEVRVCVWAVCVCGVCGVGAGAVSEL